MIQIENIVKTYTAGDSVVRALTDISLSFRENEFVSVLGPSGCGKTTLLNILGGLDRYDSGDIKVNGVSTKNYKDKDWDAYRNHYIGFVFQNYNLIPHLTVVENVELALSIGGTKKSEKRQLALEALEKVGLKEQAKKKPNQLSGGQMQRVAIARAIVNNPEIILADEPTGALDSETSMQVMDILKEISKDHLVIMVTHNKELADKYSSRIINLLDGKLISDSKPYKPRKKAPKEKAKKPKSAMSIFTAFALSFKNLFSKKIKTFLVSFAGSIGIIGIALVLAISTGMTNYVNNLQSDTLSGYPVTITSTSLDFNSLTGLMENMGDDNQTSQDGQVAYYDYNDLFGILGRYNHFGEEFMNYVFEFELNDKQKTAEEQNLSALKVEYSTNMNMYTQMNSMIFKVNTDVSTSTLSGTTSSLFYEGLEDVDFVMENYNLEYGHYPQNKNEICLVIDSNGFALQTLSAIGIEYQKEDDGSVTGINYSDIVGKEYRLVLNEQMYTYNQDSDTITTNETVIPTPIGEFRTITPSLYNNENNVKLTISGIIKIKDDANSSIFSSGLMYTPELSEYVRTQNRNSTVVQKTLQNKKMYKPYKVNISEIKQFITIETEGETLNFESPEEMQSFIKNYYNIELSTDEFLELSLQTFGASTIPSTIYMYTKSFDAKQVITEYLNAWNSTEQGKLTPINYTDSTAFLTDSLGMLINIISYILIAFAAISLVVSSIMIGIITYTSVIERTKEIGVLRSIGARKKDISRVFNMETFIIGLTAGLIGVLFTFALTFPISAIIQAAAGGAVGTSLAILKVSDMAILVTISVLLTLVAGLLPARIAAKKDPVKALRSE
ncbi:MAG: ABC transporter ATP-binding protein/permease [Clostridiales bacterium]|nr:ABC transporter ATP-binding protein/permease [Clostridiales bacterium]